MAPVALRASALEAGLHTATCPQCGINPAGPPVERTFQHVPGWVYIGLLANVVVMMILYLVGRVRVTGTLTLCADCDAADRRGRRLRSLSVVGLVGLPLLFGFIGGIAAGVEAALVGAGAGVVGGAIGAIVAHRRPATETIGVKFANRKQNVLELTANATFRDVIEREAPDALVG